MHTLESSASSKTGRLSESEPPLLWEMRPEVENKMLEVREIA
jgi:hypothetical protein